MSAVPDRAPEPHPAPRALYAYAVQERQCFTDIAKLLKDIKQKAEERLESKQGGQNGAE